MTAIAAFKPMSKNDVADVLGVSLRTIENWVNDRTLPAPTKLGNRCYWHPVAFYAWLDRRLLGDGAAVPAAEVSAPAAPTQPPVADDAKPAKAPSAARCKSAAKSMPRVDRIRVAEKAQLQALMA
ncbi:MAG: helix-turn-helix domain-containing protein [Rubrivivax sp.]